MRKAAIRHGDPTTTRGFVLAFSSTIFDDGRQVALSGDEATCGECKGTYKIFGTGEGMREKGRSVVVDGDLVLCPCRKNRVSVGSNPGIWLEVDSGTGRTSEPDTNSHYGSFASTSTRFDEQIRAATPLGAPEGYPYLIEKTDGQTFAGRVNPGGALPRMMTGASVDDYTVYWGEDALVKANED
jgi:uncharacterized Zn-binding protein involved in type VI secretion